MNLYLWAAWCCFLLLCGLLWLFFRLKKRSCYLYRNILCTALITADGLLFLSLLIRGLRTGSAAPSFEALVSFLFAFPMHFSELSILAFTALCIAMAVSNVALIRHEGMALKNTVGTLLELIFILGTLFLYPVFRHFDTLSATTSSDFLGVLFQFIPMYAYCLLAYGECIMVGIIVMGWVAAHAVPAYDKDFIIIPGCSISKNGGLLPLVRGRVNRAIRYAWEQEIATGIPVRFIPSGGQGADEIMSEGSAMSLYLLSHSAEDYEVFPEKRSVNTWENFLCSKEIIEGLKPGAKTAFSTTNYHVLRCGMIAARLGMDSEGIASSTKWYFWPNGFAREVVAIFSMTRRYHLLAAGILALVTLAMSLATWMR